VKTPLPVSVVIATRNRPRLLADTVRSILAGDDIPAELIVIDQSDVPEPLSPCVEPHPSVVRHVPSAVRGVSLGRNAGAAAARQAVLAFADDDMLADRAWLARLTAPLAAAPGTVATGGVVAGVADVPGGFVPALVERRTAAVFSGRLPIDVLAGGNMAIHREVFVAMGGFDARLGPGSQCPAAEDNDLGFRLLEAGHPVRYVPDAMLQHRAWRPLAEYIPLKHAYGRGKGGFYMKHASLRDLHMVRRMTRDLGWRVLRALRRPWRPRFVVGELAYAAGVLRGAAWWLRHGRPPLEGPQRHLSNQSHVTRRPLPR
jgi:glycosyltransferase involved in cell wall biosynthesis